MPSIKVHIAYDEDEWTIESDDLSFSSEFDTMHSMFSQLNFLSEMCFPDENKLKYEVKIGDILISKKPDNEFVSCYDHFEYIDMLVYSCIKFFYCDKTRNSDILRYIKDNQDDNSTSMLIHDIRRNILKITSDIRFENNRGD